jgi:hypothetical protein
MSNKQIPAFPLENIPYHSGMTLRDYFAAKALPLVMQMRTDDYNKEMGKDWNWDIGEDAEDIAKLTYKLANAMLEARDE